MSQDTEQREQGRRDEERIVRRWRREQFVALGFSPVEMRRLVTAGCPLDTARRILV